MSDAKIIELALGDPKWEQALPVLQLLRPHMDRATLDQVLREGAPQGLRFTALFDGSQCVAVAGWRVMASTTVARRFYIDAIVTATEARGQGHGTRLFRLLVSRARQLRCSAIELNANVDRHAAHRFLLREGMDITAHHFRMDLQ